MAFGCRSTGTSSRAVPVLVVIVAWQQARVLHGASEPWARLHGAPPFRCRLAEINSTCWTSSVKRASSAGLPPARSDLGDREAAEQVLV